MSAPIDVSSLSPGERRALLERLLTQEAEASAAAHPTSYGQQAMWFLHKLAPDSPAYNIMYAGRVRGPLDEATLEWACQALVDRHPMLRTTYSLRDGAPVQLVHPRRSVPLNRHDATGWSERELGEWLRDAAHRPFDLRTGPVLRLDLLRRAPEEHVLLLALHHIAADLWSLDVMLDELRVLYAAGPGAAPLAPPAVPYVDHVRWQSSMLASAEGERLHRYWSRQLAGGLPTLRLPADRPRPAVQTYQGAVHDFAVGRVLAGRLRDVAQQAGATLYTTLLAAFAVLLHRYTGQRDLLVGTPMAGREQPGLEGVVGYLANPVALRIGVHDDPAFGSLLAGVRETVLGALAHQEYPFSLLVERLKPGRDPGHTPLFQVSFVWEQPRRFQEGAHPRPDAGDGGRAAGGRSLSLETIALGQGGAPLDLMVLMGERDGGLSGALQYNSDLFEAGTMARMAAHFETLLAAVAADPGQRVSRLPLLTEAERRQQVEWNTTAVDYPGPDCLHELVEAQVRRSPGAVAVSFRDRELTYAELDGRAGELAGRLRALGVGPDVVVPVFLERSLELVVALLGVVKAGGAFLPLDPAQPTARLAAILADAPDAAVCVTARPLLERLPAFGGERLCVDDAPPPTAPHAPAARTTGDDIAYVIHTSGSTGRPKGAMNTHRGIRNRLLWMQDTYRLDAGDRVLHKTPIGFDVSVWEIFWPLVAGSTVVVAEPDGHRDSAYLVRTIVDRGVTTAHFVPSLLRAFLADPGVTACRSLRHVFCSGEVLPYDLQARFQSLLGAELYNLYGPTECAIDVTHFHCRRDATGPPVPIGRPIANTRIHLLDAHLQPVPVGVPGELYIGGVGVARGYLNRPDLTAASFLSDPFVEDPDARLYRTGDLARYRPDGTVEFLGRVDEQVKISGVRIEPHEVQTALDAHPAVRESVVVAGETEPGAHRLVAYVVAAGGSAPETADLRSFLLERLPPAMVPAVFVPVERLPLTPSGKVDRRALVAEHGLPGGGEGRYGPPRNATESVLAGIWRTVLNLERVGVDDDFFALGGTSTQSVDLAARASAAGLALTPESVFRYSTIAELAAMYGPEPPGDPPAPNTVIESLGVHLPPTVVTTQEVLDGCESEVTIPMERLTGIRSRRLAGDGEYSIDLARHALADCLAGSSYRADEIDLVIACSISRCDGPGHRFTYEPSTAARLREQCGLTNALPFDISNACAGMFTGIAVADAFLKTGAVQRAVVVSGEYVTHLIETAQKEIEGFLDPRLACLTVGDAGAAVLLERGPDDRVGFHDVDLCTLSRYSTLCVAKATDRAHGGAIMLADSVNQTAVAVKRAVPYTAGVMRRHGWLPEHCDHLVMHQTSEASINDAVTAISRLFGEAVAHRGNTIYNLKERGNTASTTHFVALGDHIRSGRIKSGDRAVFSITGSGQTVGAALYTFDDLPDRLRDGAGSPRRRATVAGDGERHPPLPRVRIAGVGTARAQDLARRSSTGLAVAAATACLDRASLDRGQLDLLIHAGVYRDEFLSEPAIAALVAGELGINDDIESIDEPKTLAFDVVNGGVGFLNACQVAVQMIAAGKGANAMVLASEVENNAPGTDHPPRGVAETGSALVLARSEDGAAGFGRFAFHHDGSHGDALAAYTRHAGGRVWLEVERDPDLACYYLDCAPAAVEDLLASEGLDRSDIAIVFPPQMSSGFVTALSERTGIARERFVDIEPGQDYFTSSLAFGLQHSWERGLVRPGDVGLLISVGSGLQVGCATYRF